MCTQRVLQVGDSALLLIYAAVAGGPPELGGISCCEANFSTGCCDQTANGSGAEHPRDFNHSRLYLLMSRHIG